jgi:hypothetical protein
LAVGVIVGVSTFSGPGQGQSSSTTTDDADGPRGIHLSFTENPAETMAVTWFTDGSTAADMHVRYADDCATLSATETPKRVEAEASALTVPGDTFVHEATITGLSPGERFGYQVGNERLGFSECYPAQTAPEDGPVDVVLYGDQGLSPAA